MKVKTVIVTGELNEIGRRTVQEFADEGAHIIIWSTKFSPESLKEFTLKNIPNYEFYKVDIADLKQVESAGAYVFNKYKKIDVLINNANADKAASTRGETEDQWEKVIDINLTAVFNCIKVVAPYMVKNAYGRIINAASMASISQNLDQTNYEATKSGLYGITRVWARELTKHGVTVNAVCSGFLEPEHSTKISKEKLNSLREIIPAGRLGKPEEIVKVYKFLASNDASYISGAVLNVDGGYFA